MTHAFPEDELRPLSCKPLSRDRENPAHIEVNDVLGNYSLTLIDSLSTLAILASNPADKKYNKPLLLFQNGVRDLIQQYGDGTNGPAGTGLRAKGFDLDSKVQVFETAIRGLGGLLSAHLFAVGDLPIRGYDPQPKHALYAKIWHKDRFEGKSKGLQWTNGFEYDGQLLRLAHDLGSRLLPAFWTTTGIPYPRVNLRHGIPFYTNSPLNADPEAGFCDAQQANGRPEITETCSAGAGSLILEFTTLSRLTGDPRFEELAKRAFWSIWNRRSDLDLIGAGIDAETGNWVSSWTGIGAGIDSFFEYAMKAHILLSRDVHPVYDDVIEAQDPRTLFEPLTAGQDSAASFLDVWNEAHGAIFRHLYRGSNQQHPHYVQGDLVTGAARGFWIDALSAYFPGLLTLAGHVEEAIKTHLLQTALWTRFSALPERWSLITGGIEGGLGWWVGRPEFIESTYYIYRATEDPWYLHVGEMVLRDIKRRCWTRCGWASLQDVLTGEKTDRMESFFLGETAKYLFLLFDPQHPLNHLDQPFVFTTEGHPLIIPGDANAGNKHGTLWQLGVSSEAVCPAKPAPLPFGVSATAARGDVYHAAALARLQLMTTRDNVESVLGEYTDDHPSISLSDISSPSNYTYFPWTLPPSLIPFDAKSDKMQNQPTFDISFPTLPNSGQSSPPLQRVKEGILINVLGGLRLGMIKDVPLFLDAMTESGYRIQAINNLPLGKDEKVFLPRDSGYNSLNPTDPNFTRIRDSTMLDLVIDLKSSSEANGTAGQTQEIEIELPVSFNSGNDGAMKSAWNAIVTQISNMIKDKPQFPYSSTSTPGLDDIGNNNKRFVLAAITPTGMGAAPIPDWPEVNAFPKSHSDPKPLPWGKIYATDELCSHKLPLQIVRNHQILIIKRGGCSFSEKLANIPSYVPSDKSLQLVIVVSPSEDEHDTQNDPAESLIRPYLEKQQTTSGGIPRHHPIPMIMVGGGEKAYNALRDAEGIGIRRRYSMHSQGVPIVNLLII